MQKWLKWCRGVWGRDSVSWATCHLPGPCPGLCSCPVTGAARTLTGGPMALLYRRRASSPHRAQFALPATPFPMADTLGSRTWNGTVSGELKTGAPGLQSQSRAVLVRNPQNQAEISPPWGLPAPVLLLLRAASFLLILYQNTHSLGPSGANKLREHHISQLCAFSPSILSTCN